MESLISRLNKDMIHEVCICLPVRDLLNFRVTCKRFIMFLHDDIEKALDFISKNLLFTAITYFSKVNKKEFVKFFIDRCAKGWRFDSLLMSDCQDKVPLTFSLSTWDIILEHLNDLSLMCYCIERSSNKVNLDYALACASRTRNYEAINYFISIGAKDFNWGISWAAYGGHLDVIKFLMSKISIRDINPDWAMSSAARGGHMEIINFFIDLGASNWSYALSWAARGGNIGVAKFFLSKATDIDLFIPYSIYLAQKANQQEMVDFLEKLQI